MTKRHNGRQHKDPQDLIGYSAEILALANSDNPCNRTSESSTGTDNSDSCQKTAKRQKKIDNVSKEASDTDSTRPTLFGGSRSSSPHEKKGHQNSSAWNAKYFINELDRTMEKPEAFEAKLARAAEQAAKEALAAKEARAAKQAADLAVERAAALAEKLSAALEANPAANKENTPVKHQNRLRHV